MLKISSKSEPEKAKYMRFANDDEFFNFCVVPQFIMYDGEPDSYGNSRKYYTFDFTDQYNQAINDNVKFMIQDPDSKIVRRGMVTLGLLSRPVSNLLHYYYDEPINKEI